jgi:hypothetical protein
MRKDFFSEEKKQQTFATGPAHGTRHTTLNRRAPWKQKFFASFL